MCTGWHRPAYLPWKGHRHSDCRAASGSGQRLSGLVCGAGVAGEPTISRGAQTACGTANTRRRADVQPSTDEGQITGSNAALGLSPAADGVYKTAKQLNAL